MGNYYRFVEEEDGHFRVHSKEGVMMDLFVGNEKALLWDTGYCYGPLQKEVKEVIGEMPLFIVNSHGHLDHTCGNYQFEEEIYIHEKDMELCREHTNRAQRVHSVELAKEHVDFLTGEMENILPDDFDEEGFLHAGTGNLKPVKEGDTFCLGGITLTIYEFPGHTRGSIGLLWQEEKLLFVADAMNACVWLFLPESLMLSDYINTLKKAKAMDIVGLYMGHQPTREEKSVLDDYLDIAENLDFEKGFPFENKIVSAAEARICVREGYGPMDFMKPGFASVVISKEHI